MNRILSIIVVFAFLFVLSPVVCRADTPEEAVHKAVHDRQKGETDINGDGLNVMPPTVTKDSDKTRVVGEIRHTWKNKEPTPIKYNVTVDTGGKVSGTIDFVKVNNPDGEEIGENKSGTLTGTVKTLKSSILSNYSAMRGAVHLIELVLQEVMKGS